MICLWFPLSGVICLLHLINIPVLYNRLAHTEHPSNTSSCFVVTLSFFALISCICSCSLHSDHVCFICSSLCPNLISTVSLLLSQYRQISSPNIHSLKITKIRTPTHLRFLSKWHKFQFEFEEVMVRGFPTYFCGCCLFFCTYKTSNLQHFIFYVITNPVVYITHSRSEDEWEL